jgi:protein-tyrosine phosphatase
LNILFICSRNKWRSRTAETIFRKSPYFNVKSAGTEPTAVVRVNLKLIEWADIIFVMENKHKSRLKSLFSNEISNKRIIVLDIPDEYQYMDEELIEILKSSVAVYYDHGI